VQLLLALYTGFAVLILLLLTMTPGGIAPRVRNLMLAADVGFGGLLTLATGGPGSLLFPFLLFPLLSIAHRSVWRETLATTAAIVGVLGVQALLVGTSPPSIGLLQGNFVSGQLITRLFYVAVTGLLLAALAAKDQRRRAQAATIGAVMDQAGTAAGLEGMLEAVLGIVIDTFAAERAVLVLRRPATNQVFLWNAAPRPDARYAVITSSEIDEEESQSYLFDVPGARWHALRLRAADWFDLVAVDNAGRRLPTRAFTFPAAFLAAFRCRSVLGVSIVFGEEWAGRVLLINPRTKANREAALHLVEPLVRHIGPAAHQNYLLRTLRAQAVAGERARLSRALHDGIVQSLIAAEIQVEVVRRQCETEAPLLAAALVRVRTLLRTETRNVR
jgi:signal transduction histidine kinase